MGEGRGRVRDTNGGNPASYDWLGGGGQAGWPVSCHIHTQGTVRVWPSQGSHLLRYGDHSWAQFEGGAGEGGWRGWGRVRDRKGGKVTSYDWLGGGGGRSAGTYTHRVQFTLAFHSFWVQVCEFISKGKLHSFVHVLNNFKILGKREKSSAIIHIRV
jgi:hypothetical protein